MTARCARARSGRLGVVHLPGWCEGTSASLAFRSRGECPFGSTGSMPMAEWTHRPRTTDSRAIPARGFSLRSDLRTTGRPAVVRAAPMRGSSRNDASAERPRIDACGGSRVNRLFGYFEHPDRLVAEPVRIFLWSGPPCRLPLFTVRVGSRRRSGRGGLGSGIRGLLFGRGCGVRGRIGVGG